jgi:4-alpha-glucanotransferase
MVIEPQSYEELINELSEMCGVLPEYWDIFGKKHIASLDTKKAVLRAMRLKIDSVEDLINEINKRKWKQWKNFIEPVYIKSNNDQPIAISVYIPVKDGEETKLTISCSIKDEQNKKTYHILTESPVSVAEQQRIDGIRYVKVDISDTKQRDTGYYRITVECKHPENIFADGNNAIQKTSRLIITPDVCYIPSELLEGRTWGLSVNLYAIRSDRNWGIGDLTDLKKIVRWIAGLNSGFVGINPLHAIPNTKPFGISPYAPVSRLYKNFIYLDMQNIPECKESEDIKMILHSGDFKKELDELKKDHFINYEKVALLKEHILEKAFELFYAKHYIKNTSRCSDFKKYISGHDATLDSFALFSALWNYMKETKNIYTWQKWPEQYHNPSSTAIQEFRKLHKKKILFYKYIQWLIDSQLKEVSDEAGHLKMPIGLYYDLAIGSIAGGNDNWCYQDVFSFDVDVGSPPDDFSPKGQNWGFPPIIPEKLRESGYELFIQTIRNNMKYGGAIRIDHALGLFRLFWVPRGMSPKDGVYISYPSEDLLRIIALESFMNKTIVIAEDLGTVGENVRNMLKRFNMLSYRLFYFERNYPDPSFTPPEKYPSMALCAITTHDLPTIYGYWEGQDFKMKKQLNMYSDDTLLEKQLNERERDKELIFSSLKSLSILPSDYSSELKSIPHMTPELCKAIYQYLALTPCKLLLVSMDDILGTMNQQNMPGTLDEHPNWIQKTPLSLEEVISDKRFIELSAMLRSLIKK